jgi:hypothetical protein
MRVADCTARQLSKQPREKRVAYVTIKPWHGTRTNSSSETIAYHQIGVANDKGINEPLDI